MNDATRSISAAAVGVLATIYQVPIAHERYAIVASGLEGMSEGTRSIRAAASPETVPETPTFGGEVSAT